MRNAARLGMLAAMRADAVHSAVARARRLAAAPDFARDRDLVADALAAIAEAAEACAMLAAARLDGRAQGRAAFAALAETGAISAGEAQVLASLHGFRRLAAGQCSPMDLGMIAAVLQGEDLAMLENFAQRFEAADAG